MTAARGWAAPAPCEFTIGARQLARAVALVKPHVGTDDTLPVLTHYRVESGGGDLYLVATDRYTLGVARVAPDKGAEPFPDGIACMLRAPFADRALRLFKPARARDKDVPLTFTFGDDSVRVENTDGSRLVEKVAPGMEFPRWRPLLAGLKDATYDGMGAWASHQIGKLAGVQKITREPLVMRMRGGMSGPSKLSFVYSGDTFAAAIMPVRPAGTAADEAGQFDAWLARLAAVGAK